MPGPAEGEVPVLLRLPPKDVHHFRRHVDNALAIALFGAGKHVNQFLLPPEHRVKCGFPLADRRGRQIFQAPLPSAQVIADGDRDLVAAAFVAEQQVGFVSRTGGVGEAGLWSRWSSTSG